MSRVMVSGKIGQGAAMVAAVMLLMTPAAQAEVDGHGADSWRVTGVASNDVLNVRSGPGTQHPINNSFAHNERGLQQITCVPLYTPAQFSAMTAAQIKALPPRWCLMRNAAMTKTGWVAQRFITPDSGPVAPPPTARPAPSTAASKPADSSNAMVTEATAIVRRLYEAQARADQGQGPDPLQGRAANDYFTADIVAKLQGGGIDAHPLYGAQDFSGRISRIAADAKQPMYRGMITVHADFTNFGQPQRATYVLRADTTQRGAPMRIFRVEHDGWSYP